MKKFVVSSFVFLFVFAMVGVVFAGSSVSKNNKKDVPEEVKVFTLGQARVAVAEASFLSNETANIILDNSGNYTFFKKQGSNAGDVEDFDGLTMYIKAFGGQDKLDMKDYTKFNTTYYSVMLGLDTDRQYTDNFDATYGVFVSYAGVQSEEENFNDDKISQNGIFAGVRGNWYVDKLFFGAILDYGFISNKTEFFAQEKNWSEDYNIQSIGLSVKAGYNFEIKERSFTIQPNIIFNINYLITEEYDALTGYVNGGKFKTDDMTNFAAAPGVKLAKTLGKCWILSGEGKYVFVSTSNGDIKVESDSQCKYVPETYYKDYASLGLGIEKIWGYTVLHLKVNKNLCGRDGFIINAGIEFKF